ncbi:sugar transferase [Actinokineospora sp. NBRC 105648]|uniref:sugar transferase n=1 Tax=Actinokineospora sp. NBRC 105648 TaxID=3032206 RepID=UPI0025549A42|nr:sugar transferase [Actinokineospora sp. NBRC 105648]
MRSLLAVSDAAVALAAAGLVPLVGGGGRAIEQRPLLTTVAAAAVLWLVLAVSGSRDPRVLGVGQEEYKRLVSAHAHLAGVIAVVGYLSRTETPRAYLLIALPAGLGALLLTRWCWRQWLHAHRRRGEGWSHRVLAVGSGPQVRELSEQLAGRRHLGYDVVAAWIVGQDAGTDAAETARAVLRLARRNDADVIAVTTCDAMGAEVLRRLGWLLEGTGTQLVVVPGLVAVAGPRVHTRPIAGLHLLCIEEPAFTGAGRVAKRLFDVAAATAGLLALSPVLLAIAVVVRVESRGPVLHRQTRIGKHGRPFRMVKFRTMVADAERRQAALRTVNEQDGPLFKIRDDPRVTRVGRFLRRYSLDELPQLYNVVVGRMSLVGPRPPLPEEVRQYAKDTRRRLLVKPGLTGLWQISGRSNLTWTDGIALDLHYVENWSFTTDLVILWKTARVVAAGTGAY